MHYWERYGGLPFYYYAVIATMRTEVDLDEEFMISVTQGSRCLLM